MEEEKKGWSPGSLDVRFWFRLPSHWRICLDLCRSHLFHLSLGSAASMLILLPGLHPPSSCWDLGWPALDGTLQCHRVGMVQEQRDRQVSFPLETHNLGLLPGWGLENVNLFIAWVIQFTVQFPGNVSFQWAFFFSCSVYHNLSTLHCVVLFY